MNWYANLKIGMKLAIGFGLIIVLVSILAIYSMITANSIDSNYSYLTEYPQARYNTLMNMNVSFITMRRSVSHMSVYVGDDSAVTEINNLSNTINSLMSDIRANIETYKDLVNNDPRFSAADKNDRIKAIEDVDIFLSQYYDKLAVPMTQANLDGNLHEVMTIATQNADISNNLISGIEDLTAKAKGIVDELDTGTSTQAQQSIMILTALSVITILVSILLAVIITRLITKPIKRIVALVSDVAQGRLNINIDRSNVSKDEIGELTLDVYDLIDVIKAIINDLSQLTHDIMVDGDSDQRIDISKFQGSYLEMTSGINDFVDGYIDEISQLIDMLVEISNGNFNVKMKQLPGNKASINQRVDELTGNLKNIYAELSNLAENAASGKLAARADAGRYHGDWATIMNVLNRLMEAIAAPIHEAAEVLGQVSAGNFDNKMQGDYRGDFLIIKSSINNTVTNVASYIDEISRVLGAMADDDLNQGISREYVGAFSNIKDAINNIIDKLNRVISEIFVAADQVASGAKQISESSMTLAQGATEQASSVQELNATIQTINDSTSRNADNAKEAEELSNSSKDSAAKGDRDMNNMLVSMEGIKESSNSISKIIKVIDDIAFQTNLLALNAAVEAARAGEQGKGFAVVAGEVRTLAARSQSAAKDTAVLIEESITRVNDGTEIAGQTAEALQAIVTDVTKVANIITGIASASKEQALSINQVMDGTTQIAEVVQSNSATSEEAASASEQLSSQADVLKSLVQVFKLKNA